MYELKIKSVDDGGAVTESGAVTVDPETLGGKVRSRLVHEACIMYAANRRVGTHKTKSRGEVNFSNKKPWRQKGTGRARAGSRRSPLWRGGGTIFGPRPRDYSYALPKKARRRATQSALHSKLRDGEATVVSSLPDSGKTREMAAFIKALGIDGRVMIAAPAPTEAQVRAVRNLPNVVIRPVAELNAYELLLFKQLVLTADGLTQALERFGAPAASAATGEEA